MYNAKMDVGRATDTGGWKRGPNGIEMSGVDCPSLHEAHHLWLLYKTKCSTVRCKIIKAGQVCMVFNVHVTHPG